VLECIVSNIAELDSDGVVWFSFTTNFKEHAFGWDWKCTDNVVCNGFTIPGNFVVSGVGVHCVFTPDFTGDCPDFFSGKGFSV
jgi:hypothetical protein